jgi:hypothetical protein
MFWCVSSTRTTCDVVPSRSIGGNCSIWYESDLELTPGQKYYVIMVAVNEAGLSTTSVSSGVVVGRNKVVLSDVIDANVTTGVTLMFDSLTLSQEARARNALDNSTGPPSNVPPVFGTITMPDANIQAASKYILQTAAASSAATTYANTSDLPEGFAKPTNETVKPSVSMRV